MDDAGALEEAVRPGPWQTLLTVLPVLSAGTAATLTEAELVALQRLSAEEAAVAAQALQLTEGTAGLLQMLEPDMLALLGGGADRYVWINPTPTETAHLGMPRR